MIRTCQRCGIRFTASNGHRMFCSDECRAIPLADRFWAKVNKDGPIHPVLNTACWLWTATAGNRGHGRVKTQTDKFRGAHVVSWELHVGKVEPGILVLHKCDNPPCVNPDHLFLGTHQDNMSDMVAKNRQARGNSSGRSILTEAQVIDIRSMRRGGVDTNELAAKYGVHRSTVEWASRVGWTHVAGIIKGKLRSRNGKPVITDATRRAIRYERDMNGLTYPAIGAMFKLSKSHVHRICTRWADPAIRDEGRV